MRIHLSSSSHHAFKSRCFALYYLSMQIIPPHNYKTPAFHLRLCLLGLTDDSDCEMLQAGTGDYRFKTGRAHGALRCHML
jgi:hypothetical protein